MTRQLPRAKIAAFFTALAAAMPEPKGELNYVNHYTLLVAVVLSAQATDVGVNKATGPLFKKIRTPRAMLARSTSTPPMPARAKRARGCRWPGYSSR